MACKEIRDTIRSNLIESRKISRDKALVTKRKALEETLFLGRDLTESEVVLIGNKLKNKSTVNLDDLALLKIAFVQKANNILVFLKVKGALHALVRELSSKYSSSFLYYTF